MLQKMYRNNTLIESKDLPDEFANFFKDKVTSIVNTLEIDDNVYNGTRKMIAENDDFMTENDILIVMNSLKIKTVKAMIVYP